MRIAIVAITKEGKGIARELRRNLGSDAEIFYLTSADSLKNMIGGIFNKNKFKGIIFIMALGIAVRVIAGYMKDKYHDPAIVVIDEARRWAVSLLCGHEGGANRLAIEAANILRLQPVITTASESKKNIIIGLGCRRGIEKKEIIKAIFYAITKTRHSLRQIRYIATVDLKKDEPGLVDASMELGIPLRIIPFDEIKNFKGNYQKSDFVRKKIGIEGVSEPCALLAGRNTRLILPKTRLTGITIAISRED